MQRPLVWTLCLVLMLDLILCALSTTYCIAQRIEAPLSLITFCDHKRSTEIWRHSFESRTVDEDRNVVMTEESQYGHSLITQFVAL